MHHSVHTNLTFAHLATRTVHTHWAVRPVDAGVHAQWCAYEFHTGTKQRPADSLALKGWGQCRVKSPSHKVLYTTYQLSSYAWSLCFLPALVAWLGTHSASSSNLGFPMRPESLFGFFILMVYENERFGTGLRLRRKRVSNCSPSLCCHNSPCSGLIYYHE